MALFNRFWRDESGATAIEYVLIASIVTIGLIACMRLIGSNTGDRFTAVASNLT